MLINGNYIVCVCIGEDRSCFQHLAINTRLTGVFTVRYMKETNLV